MEKLKESRLSYIQNYFLAFLLLIFLLFLQTLKLEEELMVPITFGIFASITFLFLEPEYKRVEKYYLIEEKNIIMEKGIFSKKRISIPYDQVADVSISKSILGRIFKFGDVVVTGVKNQIEMKGMRNPDNLYEKIKARIDKSKKG